VPAASTEHPEQAVSTTIFWAAVSGVLTVLVDGIRLFSGATPPDLMEAELRKAADHVIRS
jgi:hypothetical protein